MLRKVFGFALALAAIGLFAIAAAPPSFASPSSVVGSAVPLLDDKACFPVIDDLVAAKHIDTIVAPVVAAPEVAAIIRRDDVIAPLMTRGDIIIIAPVVVGDIAPFARSDGGTVFVASAGGSGTGALDPGGTGGLEPGGGIATIPREGSGRI